MKSRKLTPPATAPGFIDVEAIDSADGGMCLAIGRRRVAGCEPALTANNIRYRWNVRVDDLRRIVEVDPEHEKWLAALAERCEVPNGPCEGCMQGAACDGTDRP